MLSRQPRTGPSTWSIVPRNPDAEPGMACTRVLLHIPFLITSLGRDKYERPRLDFSFNILSSIMRFIGILCVLGLSALSSAQVNLGAAQSYGILGKSTVTNTGNTTIVGDLGTGGISITGQTSLVVTGRIVIGDETLTAFSDAGAAYTAINGFGPSLIPGMELGGLVLSPGVFRFTSSAQLTGTLTLNGTGSPNDAWYFQIASTLTTAPDAAVVFIGGGTPCNVYWTVGTSATIDRRTSFAGTILASASVTFNGNAVLLGRAIGLTGAVTMISNAIVVTNNCPVSSSSTSTTLASSTPPVGPPVPTDLFSIATTPLIPSGTPLSQGPGGQIPPSVTVILPNSQSSDTLSRTVSATTSSQLPIPEFPSPQTAIFQTFSSKVASLQSLGFQSLGSETSSSYTPGLPAVSSGLSNYELSNYDFSNYEFSNYEFSNYEFSNYEFSNYEFSNYEFSNYEFSNYEFSNYEFSNWLPIFQLPNYKL
ncbi:uncharacterized protein L3040_005184 [Drepanopeziza brunnea f. sp. 'multigermtubi']|uniref:uncharacterized protein n=1 Tax=Drepanopeziza brunnea f. sp. 'multigermtubi' TaxID=698441 RepID=UPI002397475D|nr:hypothetical protein L3040_005184 [Drepanopeziza brunnea f. sp. 'multigermtubi']